MWKLFILKFLCNAKAFPIKISSCKCTMEIWMKLKYFLHVHFVYELFPWTKIRYYLDSFSIVEKLSDPFLKKIPSITVN